MSRRPIVAAPTRAYALYPHENLIIGLLWADGRDTFFLLIIAKIN